MKHASTCSSWHRFSAVTIRWPHGRAGSRGVTEGLRSCGCFRSFVEVQIFRAKERFPKILHQISDEEVLWLLQVLAWQLSPSQCLIWGKYYEELFALVGSWLVPKVSSFLLMGLHPWDVTVKLFTNWQVWQQNNDNDDNKLITRTILTYFDPNTNSKLLELFDIYFFHVLRKSPYNLTLPSEWFQHISTSSKIQHLPPISLQRWCLEPMGS